MRSDRPILQAYALTQDDRVTPDTGRRGPAHWEVIRGAVERSCLAQESFPNTAGGPALSLNGWDEQDDVSETSYPVTNAAQ